MTKPTLVPELCVCDLSASLHFYVDLLGFRIEYQRPENGFASISLRGAHLMLEQTPSREASDDEAFQRGEWRTGRLEYPLGRSVNFEITLADVDAVYARVLSADYPRKVDLHEKWYRVADRRVGVRQFLLMDPDGYLIRIAQDFAEMPADRVPA